MCRLYNPTPAALKSAPADPACKNGTSLEQQLFAFPFSCTATAATSSELVAIAADIIKAGMVLATLMVGANYEIGHFCPLEEKLSMQGTGLGWWIDVLSGQAIIAVYVIYFFMCYQNKLPKALIPGLCSGFGFSLLANLFHLLLDEYGEYPHWSFAFAFLLMGGHSLYTFIQQVGILCGAGEKNAKAQQVLSSTKVHLLCLIAMPFAHLALVPVSVAFDSLNRFTYNGFVFLFVGYSIDGVLAHGARETNVKEFHYARLWFPLLSLAFILEGFFVRYLKMDSHVFAHFFVAIFVYQMNTGITKAYKLKAKIN